MPSMAAFNVQRVRTLSCFFVPWDLSRFGWDAGEEDERFRSGVDGGTEEVAERRSQAPN